MDVTNEHHKTVAWVCTVSAATLFSRSWRYCADCMYSQKLTYIAFSESTTINRYPSTICTQTEDTHTLLTTNGRVKLTTCNTPHNVSDLTGNVNTEQQ